VSQSDTPNIQVLSTEVLQLRQELQLRDQLVQQLSQELFRLVKGNTLVLCPSSRRLNAI
jgi:Rad3-related DNA helicase